MWSLAKTLRIPIDTKIKELQDIPYTISYVMKKRMQLDNFNELPEEKRPPEELIWEGTPEEVKEWLDDVLKRQGSKDTEIDLTSIEE